MLSIEQLNRPFSEDELVREAQDASPELTILAFGVCAYITDNNGNVFYARHSQNDKYPDDSVGTSSETIKWDYNSGNYPRTTETPLQTWSRSLQEELGIDQERFNQAGLYFDSLEPGSRSFIRGVTSVPNQVLSSINIFVKVENPEILTFGKPTSAEINSTGFTSLDKLQYLSPFRPGFLNWFIDCEKNLPASNRDNSRVYLEFIELSSVGDDTALLDTSKS
jgi:hypothetical protein